MPIMIFDVELGRKKLPSFAMLPTFAIDRKHGVGGTSAIPQRAPFKY